MLTNIVVVVVFVGVVLIIREKTDLTADLVHLGSNCSCDAEVGVELRVVDTVMEQVKPKILMIELKHIDIFLKSQ